MLGRFGACAKMACASHPRRDGGSGSEFSRACTKLTISCAGIVYDTTKRITMGNNSVRFRFEWDIIGTVKSIIGSTSSFLHNLSSFSYRVDTGRALGIVVAFFAFRAGDVAIEGLGELSCVIAIIVVAAFSLYGADDSETEDALLSLMTASAECRPRSTRRRTRRPSATAAAPSPGSTTSRLAPPARRAEALEKTRPWSIPCYTDSPRTPRLGRVFHV